MSDDHDKALTILIADDNDDIRTFFRRFLEQAQHRVLEAANGREAVEIAHREKLDLIMMDLNMPVMVATREIRRHEASEHVPIIVMTAHGSFGISLFSEPDDLGTGRIEYLAKPFSLNALEDLIKQISRAE
jgi:CheY-like chemotaxis protein